MVVVRNQGGILKNHHRQSYHFGVMLSILFTALKSLASPIFTRSGKDLVNL